MSYFEKPFDPRTTAGTRTYRRRREMAGRDACGRFQPDPPAADLDTFCAEQQARIVTQFAIQDQERLERRWVDGQWVGRSGLELQESRK